MSTLSGQTHFSKQRADWQEMKWWYMEREKIVILIMFRLLALECLEALRNAGVSGKVIIYKISLLFNLLYVWIWFQKASNRLCFRFFCCPTLHTVLSCPMFVCLSVCPFFLVLFPLSLSLFFSFLFSFFLLNLFCSTGQTNVQTNWQTGKGMQTAVERNGTTTETEAGRFHIFLCELGQEERLQPLQQNNT